MSLFRFIPAFTGAVNGVLNLDGETGITNTEGGGGFALAGIGLNHASYGGPGTIYKVAGVSSAQIDTATDWVIPNVMYSKLPYKAYVIDNLGNLDAASDTIGAWIDISDGSAKAWYVARQAVGTTNFDITLRISDDGGSTYVEGNYTGSVTKV